MATREEINTIIERFKNLPKQLMNKIDRHNFGMGHLLHYLAYVGKPVSAGEISNIMHVSTARVAALLRCMTDKGLIVKESDPSDARKTMVCISDKGRHVVEHSEAEIYDMVARVIEKVGYDEVNYFIDKAYEIHAVVADMISGKDPLDCNYYNKELKEHD